MVPNVKSTAVFSETTVKLQCALFCKISHSTTSSSACSTYRVFLKSGHPFLTKTKNRRQSPELTTQKQSRPILGFTICWGFKFKTLSIKGFLNQATIGCHDFSLQPAVTVDCSPPILCPAGNNFLCGICYPVLPSTTQFSVLSTAQYYPVLPSTTQY